MNAAEHYKYLRFKPLNLSNFSKTIVFSADEMGSYSDLSFLRFDDWWQGANVSHIISKVGRRYTISVMITSTKVKYQFEVRTCESFEDELKAKVYGLYYERLVSNEINGTDEIKEEFFPISLN